jgi:hypothetical protein
MLVKNLLLAIHIYMNEERLDRTANLVGKHLA